MKEKKLFFVDFGMGESRGVKISPFRGIVCDDDDTESSVFVVASDYNEAAEKALAYVEYKKSIENGKKKSVLTPDGSLNNWVNDKEKDAIKIKSIGIVDEDVVW